MAPTSQKLKQFSKTIWSHYRAHKRDMPWRHDTSSYSIVVSEIMLQQTQVSRVLVKYESWMKRFPTWRSLAKAPTKNVLQEWSGLGYNRRALYLKRIAEKLTEKDGHALLKRLSQRAHASEKAAGQEPRQAVAEGERVRLSMLTDLRTLPGIGPNTAGSILAFAYNIPHPFIETNIRSVFIHFFFKDRNEKVSDAEIMPLIEKCLADRTIHAHVREWYWALMDYGAHLKSNIPNPSRRSAHHVRQTPFKGSNRELRSNILKTIMAKPLRAADVPKKDQKNIQDLIREGFIVRSGAFLRIV